jgi:4-amino-4-deoxy-L-arabinose transferase-like glycosyltransferase
MIKKLGPACLIALVLITALGLHMRCKSVLETNVTTPLRADALDYFLYSYNLRHEGTYSRSRSIFTTPAAPIIADAVRSPGYPLFLLPFVDGPPTPQMLVKIEMAQAVISTLTLFVAFLFFLKFLPRSGALVASLLVALSPHLIVGNSYILTESLFCFLLVLSAWSMSLLRASPSPLRAGLTGISMGVASLVRPVLQFFPIVMFIPLVHHFGRRQGLRLGAFLLLGFLLTLSPWLTRNIFVQDIPGNNNLTSDFLHHGMYPDFMFDNNPDSYAFPYRFDPRTPEIAGNIGAVLKEISTRFIDHPALYLKWFLVGKPIEFWSWNTVQGIGDAFLYPISTTPYVGDKLFEWTHALMYCLHWPLVVLCLLGSLLVWHPALVRSLDSDAVGAARLASCFILYFTLLHMIGAPFPRYSFPLRPFQFGMAVFTVILICRHLRERFHRPGEAVTGAT